MLRRSAAVRAHHTESVCIIDHDAELILLLECCDLVEDTEGTCHTEYALCDQEHSTTLGLRLCTCLCNHSLAVDDVVVAELVLASYMQTDTVKQTCMVFSIIYDNVVTAYQSVDRRHDSLITEVELEGSLFLLECSKAALQFLVEVGLSCHHPASHRVCKAPLCSGFSISLADFRMVCESEVVVETPAEHILTVELHIWSEFALKAWECEISFSFLAVLSDRTAGRFSDSVKNICKHKV